MSADAPTAPRPAVRWTEHGPEPVIVEPVEVEPAPDVAPVAPAAPEEAAITEEVPAPGAQEEAAVTEEVPATGASAAMATEPEAAGGGDDVMVEAPDHIAALLARLAERGLVRQEPSPRIREIVGDAPPRPAVEPAPAEDAAPVVVPDDAEELEPEPVGPATDVRCPSCRSSQAVSLGASGYRCLSCARVWRWAICTHCAELSLTLARQESWRCTPCGDYSRSWWRTEDGRREAPTVVMRRQTDEVRRHRAAAHERARKRRWKVVLVGVLLIAATSVGALVTSDRSVPATERGATGSVCARASELRNTLASGATAPAQVRASLDTLALAANDAIPEVGLAAQRWAASGQPGDETFEAAAAEVAAACAAG